VILTTSRWLSLILLLALQAHADILLGKVIHVADGDTITVLDDTNTQHKIRLAGIDAPEKRQAFGQRSQESLSDLVFSKSVAVETDKRDKYGREVVKVLVGGVDANLVQVQRGMAWHYKAYEREQSVIDRKVYADAENEAKAARRGLWADADPVPPSDFRRRQK
jgi:endonuclease YncB( thermonuclease family)